jgi:hypothetical protein
MENRGDFDPRVFIIRHGLEMRGMIKGQLFDPIASIIPFFLLAIAVFHSIVEGDRQNYFQN